MPLYFAVDSYCECVAQFFPTCIHFPPFASLTVMSERLFQLLPGLRAVIYEICDYARERGTTSYRRLQDAAIR